ncbi:hypothetical protein CaCOL14_004912 [Colletotrichum acutatum]
MELAISRTGLASNLAAQNHAANAWSLGRPNPSRTNSPRTVKMAPKRHRSSFCQRYSMANRCIHQIRNLGFSTTCVANEGLGTARRIGGLISSQSTSDTVRRPTRQKEAQVFDSAQRRFISCQPNPVSPYAIFFCATKEINRLPGGITTPRGQSWQQVGHFGYILVLSRLAYMGHSPSGTEHR